MSSPSGFAWKQRKNGEVLITHFGKKATILRSSQAAEFADAVSSVSNSEAQELMARLTGNYKRGNERQARNHPRNQR